MTYNKSGTQMDPRNKKEEGSSENNMEAYRQNRIEGNEANWGRGWGGEKAQDRGE